MKTVIMAIGVIPSDKEVESVIMAGAQIGADTYRVQTFAIEGEDLDELRKQAHEHVDKCIEAFRTAEEKKKK